MNYKIGDYVLMKQGQFKGECLPVVAVSMNGTVLHVDPSDGGRYDWRKTRWRVFKGYVELVSAVDRLGDITR